MIIEASGVALPLDAGLPEGEELIVQAAAQALGLAPEHIASVQLVRRSVDARKKDVHFIATLVIDAPQVSDLVSITPAKGVRVQPSVPPAPLRIPREELPASEPRPVIVGAGPAGLFAALYLAQAGLNPLVLERGGSVDERVQAVEAFNNGAVLDLQTNIQFGEGGAGTFSDGKLTTGTKSPLQRDVLNWFVQAGAPEEILIKAKPHIGTDNLRNVVKNLRERIRKAGGTVVFHAQLHDIVLNNEQKLTSIVVKATSREAVDQLKACYPGTAVLSDIPTKVKNSSHAATEVLVTLPAHKLILSCGHSARDTFKMLQRHDVLMEQKPFSIGVRIEHLQDDIDQAQYGEFAGHPALEAADYKMAVHLPDGRSVYTFCMCPGGEVVAAASEEYGVVVNGMSRFAREGTNANAALLVSVKPEDFPSKDPLAGMIFQRRIEQEAFGEAHEMGGEAWQAPVQTVGDFLSRKAGTPSQTITPTYARGVVWCDLREVLPDFVCKALEDAFPLFEKKLKGFANPDAVMTGVETRSSSPVRIVRNDQTLQAMIGTRKKVRARDIARGHGEKQQILAQEIGIFPCGEGAGYAGGIMSAAVDGLHCAQALVRSYAFDSSGDQLTQIVQALKCGEAVIFPTDTVYGLGVSVGHAPSPQALFNLKGRNEDKPVAWLIGALDDIRIYGKNLSDEVLRSAQEGWPGNLTLVVEASDAVPEAYRSSEGTIGLRVPDSPLVLRIIEEVGSPLATTSANLSGESATSTFSEVNPALIEKVAAVLQDDSMGKGSASTVIDYSKDRPSTVRP